MQPIQPWPFWSISVNCPEIEAFTLSKSWNRFISTLFLPFSHAEKNGKNDYIYLLCAVVWAFCKKVSADIDIFTDLYFVFESIQSVRWESQIFLRYSHSTCFTDFTRTAHFIDVYFLSDRVKWIKQINKM